MDTMSPFSYVRFSDGDVHDLFMIEVKSTVDTVYPLTAGSHPDSSIIFSAAFSRVHRGNWPGATTSFDVVQNWADHLAAAPAFFDFFRRLAHDPVVSKAHKSFLLRRRSQLRF